MRVLFTTVSIFLFSTICHSAEVDSLPSHNIDSIVVSSYRINMKLKDAPNKVEVITRNDINRSSSINIAELIKKSINSESVDLQGLASGVEFRGFTPSSLGINKYSVMLVDGIPMGTKNAAATSLSGTAGVEIFKGPFSSLYGSGAMGGFINIITAQTKGCPTGAFEASYGSYNTFNAAANIGGNLTHRLDFDLGVSYYDRNNSYTTGEKTFGLLHSSDYEKRVLDNNARDARYNNTSLDKTNATLRIGYDFRNSWRVNFYNDIYYTSNAPSNNMLWCMDGQTSSLDVLRHFHRIDLTATPGAHSIRITPYFSRETSKDKYVSKYGNTSGENIYMTYGFQIQDAIKLTNWFTMAFGVDNYSQKYESERYDDLKAALAPWQPDYINMQTGVFAQGHLNLWSNKISGVVGVRYDNTLMKTYKTQKLDNADSKKDYNTVNPNIAFKYKIIPSLNIHTSLGTAFLAPDAFMTTGEYKTYTTIKGNPDLKPEKSLSYDVGIGYISKNRALQADATLFITEYENKIISKVIDYTTTTYINSDEASIRGVELMLSYDLGRGLGKNFSLNLYGNATRIYRSKLSSDAGETLIRYLARNNATFGIDFSYRKFSARASGRYIGWKMNDNYIYDFDPQTYEKIPFTTASGVTVRESLINEELIKMPDFMVFDLFVGYKINKFISVNFKIDNLFDELYAERDGYYMPGRNYMLTVGTIF